MENLVTCERDGAIGTIMVCRPKILNALNATVLEELRAAIVQLSQRSDDSRPATYRPRQQGLHCRCRHLRVHRRNACRCLADR